MIAEREAVRTGGKQPLGQLRSEPRTVGRVLCVDDHTVKVEFRAQRTEVCLDRIHAGRAVDVGQEQDPHEAATDVAGRTSRCKRLPPSCV